MWAWVAGEQRELALCPLWLNTRVFARPSYNFSVITVFAIVCSCMFDVPS